MKRKLPPDEFLVDLYTQGFSVKAISEKFSTSPSAVLQGLKKAGCQMRTLSESHKLAYSNGRRKVTVKSGPDHWLWKGGKEIRNYRKVIKKQICALCGSTENLCIHHKDLDHYNDEDENLQVLCVSCHTSVHKQAYWDAIHAGETPKKSNGHVGWAHDHH